MKTKSNITEKKLTKAELEAREKVMKDLKKNKSALVKRYGKDAEAVMYGRATNIAKKMAESENKNRIKELVRKALMQEADIEVGADRYEEEENLTTASHALDMLKDKLKAHDWYYYMSDDNRAYTRGSAQQSEIRSIIKDLEGMGYGKEAKELYNEFAPYSPGGPDLRMKEAKGKDLDKDGDIDSDDYLAARDAAIKKAKGEVDEADMQYVSQQREKLKKATDAFEKKKRLRALQQKTAQDKIEPLMREDIDLGHEDNEPHMIKGELYRIGKYAMELYGMLEEFEEMGGEVDFPAWWQSKITTAMNNMVSAKHYLDFEIKEPAIDAAVDALTGEEPHIGEPEAPMMEAEISAEEKLAGKIAKALKDKANKDASDQSNLKQARAALNKGNLDAAKKIADPYLEEGLPKGFFKKEFGIGGKKKVSEGAAWDKCVANIQDQGKSKEAAEKICGAINAAYVGKYK